MNDYPQIQDYERLICKVANRWYEKLPASVKRFFDVDDLIAVGRLQFLYVISKYRRKRSDVTFASFLATSLDRRYQDVVRWYSWPKRAGVMVSIEDWSPPAVTFSPDPGAAKRVQRFLDLASPDLRGLLLRRYFCPQAGRGRPPERLERFRGEAQWLQARTSVSLEDFRVVRESRQGFNEAA